MVSLVHNIARRRATYNVCNIAGSVGNVQRADLNHLSEVENRPQGATRSKCARDQVNQTETYNSIFMTTQQFKYAIEGPIAIHLTGNVTSMLTRNAIYPNDATRPYIAMLPPPPLLVVHVYRSPRPAV